MRRLVLLLVVGCSSTTTPPLGTGPMCGTSMSAQVGEQIDVSLDSTFWTVEPVSSTAVLQQTGATMHVPSVPCAPGVGCGTTLAVFDVVGKGQATINASRTSCGEALRCGPGQGQGICTITVVVGN